MDCFEEGWMEDEVAEWRWQGGMSGMSCRWQMWRGWRGGKRLHDNSHVTWHHLKNQTYDLTDLTHWSGIMEGPHGCGRPTTLLYSKTFILTLKIHLIFLPKYGKTTPSDVIIYIRKISYMRLNIRDMYEIIQNFLPSKWNIRITDRSGAYMKYSLNINGLRLNYLKCAYSYKLLNIFIRLANHVEFLIITIEKINLTS